MRNDFLPNAMVVGECCNKSGRNELDMLFGCSRMCVCVELDDQVLNGSECGRNILRYGHDDDDEDEKGVS